MKPNWLADLAGHFAETDVAPRGGTSASKAPTRACATSASLVTTFDAKAAKRLGMQVLR